MIHGNCKSQKNSLKQRLFFDAKAYFDTKTYYRVRLL